MSTPPDAKLTLTINWPEVTLDNLSRLTNLWWDVINEGIWLPGDLPMNTG